MQHHTNSKSYTDHVFLMKKGPEGPVHKSFDNMWLLGGERNNHNTTIWIYALRMRHNTIVIAQGKVDQTTLISAHRRQGD